MSHDMTSPPPVPVVDYNTPRADQVPRRKFLGVVVLAAILGAMLMGVVIYRLTARTAAMSGAIVLQGVPGSGNVTFTPASPASPSVTAVQEQIAASRTQSNETRLKELMNKTLPPTQVAYEEDPIAARQLHGKGVCNQQASRRDMSQPFFSAFEPPVYRTDGFWHENTDTEHDALLFAGPLVSSKGNQRLVILEMEVKLDGTKLANDEYKVAINRKLTYRICQPKMAGTWPDVVRNGVSLKIVQEGERNVIPIKWVDGTLRSARPAEYNVRFFAGQPDPKDPSHFTVEYEIGGVKNVIDGWLTDDDFLRIIPRGGRVDLGNWQIEAVK